MTWDEMTLVADRFIRDDGGTVRDLATGERVTLVEITVTDAAEQVALRDRCLERLDEQARGVEASRRVVNGDIRGDDGQRTLLVDFALVGESRWIEAYAMTVEKAAMETAACSREDWGIEPAIGPVVDAIAATLDGLGACDVRRLYVKAPDNARLDIFQAVVAREVRARGYVPLSPSFVAAWPAVARLLAGRSIVLLGDARCDVGGFCDIAGFGASTGFGSTGSAAYAGSAGAAGTIARAIGLLQRAASFVAAIVARVCDHMNVAALRLTPAPVSASSASLASASSVHSTGCGWSPQSVLQPARPVCTRMRTCLRCFRERDRWLESRRRRRWPMTNTSAMHSPRTGLRCKAASS